MSTWGSETGTSIQRRVDKRTRMGYLLACSTWLPPLTLRPQWAGNRSITRRIPHSAHPHVRRLLMSDDPCRWVWRRLRLASRGSARLQFSHGRPAFSGDFNVDNLRCCRDHVGQPRHSRLEVIRVHVRLAGRAVPEGFGQHELVGPFDASRPPRRCPVLLVWQGEGATRGHCRDFRANENLRGRSYRFGDKVKPNKASKRPLTQASLRCKRWLKPSSLQRIPTPLNRC